LRKIVCYYSAIHQPGSPCENEPLVLAITSFARLSKG
jgi:hypothetical protein